MIAYPWAAIVTGVLLTLSGLLCLVRHFLLEPSMPHYPKAPVFVRHGIFAFAMVLLFLGLQYIFVFFDPDAVNDVPPQPGPAIQLLATALVIYKGILLGNIVRQRYSVETWQRLNRMNESLQCRQGTLFEQVKGRLTRS
jgi:uncharacterized membrane protein